MRNSAPCSRNASCFSTARWARCSNGTSSTEADYRGERFKDYAVDVKNNSDLLVLTQPHLVLNVHREYLAAGADLIETNTFSATTIAQADFKLESLVREINLAAVRLARQAADEAEKATPGRKCFVAGALGPLNRTLSLSRDVNDPGKREVTFDQVRDAYYEQVEALVDGGVDVLLPETVFDTLNLKACLYAIDVFRTPMVAACRCMISGHHHRLPRAAHFPAKRSKPSGIPSRMFRPSASGFNCALGAALMRPYIEELSALARLLRQLLSQRRPARSAQRNGFPESPDTLAGLLERLWAAQRPGQHRGRLLRHYRPTHIRAIARRASKNFRPRTCRHRGRISA